MLRVPEVAHLDGGAAARTGEQAVLFAAGKARVVCVTPRERGSRAERWLRRHPDGVAVLSLRVHDIQPARGRWPSVAPPCAATSSTTATTSGRPWRSFEIATPLGDVRLALRRSGPGALPPGFRHAESGAGRTPTPSRSSTT